MGQFIRTGMLMLICLLIAANVESLEITDAGGQKITFEKPFSRIISLYGAHSENLFTLGLNDEIIGVSKSDDYPEQALQKKRYHYREDAEKFIAAHPDLVLIRPMIARAYPHLVGNLQKAGITVVSLQPTSIKEIFIYWQTLGMLTGRQKQAEEMTKTFEQGIAEIVKKVAAIPVSQKKVVYFEAIHSKMKTFSPSSMAIYALETAGGLNVAADAEPVRNSNIAAYGKERILSHAHEIDVFLAQKGAMNKIKRPRIMTEPGFSVIKAVQVNQVYLIDEKLVSRPTIRLLDGIRQIGGILYQELFN